MRLRRSVIRAAVMAAAFMTLVGSQAPAMPAAVNATNGIASFHIGMVTFAGYAPLYLAKNKGFFGKLDVQFSRIEDIPSLRAAVIRGDLDAYLATPDIALDTNSPPPGKAVWAIDESAGGDGVIVSGNIKTLRDLRHRTVAAEPGLPPHFVLMYLLYKNNMSLADVVLKDMSTQDAASAFVARKVDAAGIYEPYLSTSRQQRPGSRVVISSAQTPGLVVDLIFARDDVVKQHPDEIKTVISGWHKAMAYIKTNPSDAYATMAKSFKMPEKDFRDAVAGIRWLDTKDNARLYGTAQAPGPLVKNFSVVVDVLRRNRPSVYPAKASTYLIRDFLK